MQGRAIVVGGSIGGLFTAAMLRTKGWEVDVYERVDVELSGRGAGIVTHAPLLEVLELCGAGTKDLGIAIDLRTAYDPEGSVIREIRLPQLVTSWDRLHTLTRATIPADRHHLGHWLDRYEETQHGVRAHFRNGHVAEADVLIGADGFRSTVRGQLFPEILPEYAGYVVWRGVAHEADLPPDIRHEMFSSFGFFLPKDGEVIGYPIAGSNDDISPGNRRYNWVWYRVVGPSDLDDMLTDESGTRHDLSIPPPLIRRDVIAQLRDDASRDLSKPFRQILEKVEAPFFTPIYDHASPAMAKGNVAMVGDAAIVARPHIGAGVTKAAEDARAVAECLERSDNVPEGLANYNASRFEGGRKAYDRAQYLGEYLKPRYTDEAEKAEWSARHNIDTLMRDTAVLNY